MSAMHYFLAADAAAFNRTKNATNNCDRSVCVVVRRLLPFRSTRPCFCVAAATQSVPCPPQHPLISFPFSHARCHCARLTPNKHDPLRLRRKQLEIPVAKNTRGATTARRSAATTTETALDPFIDGSLKSNTSPIHNYLVRK